MKHNYKDEQLRTRAALAPKPLAGYRINQDYNRQTRRRTRIGDGRRLLGENVQTIDRGPQL